MLDPNPSQSMTPDPPIFYRKGNRHRNIENLLLSTYCAPRICICSFLRPWSEVGQGAGVVAWAVNYAINYMLVISILILIN